MPYDLISDGKPVPLGDRKYLLSPQDLAGLEVLPELVRAGVASLKIEGRLKSPEYVANITRIYRQALDKLSESRVTTRPRFTEKSDLAELAPPNRRYDMEMAFSRGLYTGWFGGTNNQQLVHARFGKKRGVFLGEVTRVLRDAVVTVELEGPLKPGDGVVFDAGKPEEKEEGGRVYEVQKSKVQSPKCRNLSSCVSATATLISRASTSATNCGRPTIRNWTGACARVSRATRRNFSGRSKSKSTASPANRSR